MTVARPTNAAALARQDEPLDALCYREYGRTAAVVEAVLAANPHLAMLPILSLGTVVTLPAVPVPTASPLVRLWD